MITLADRREVRARLSAFGQLILHGKLHGHLNGNRSGIRIENLRELLRQQTSQSFAQFHRRLMCKPCKHDVSEFACLFLNRFDDFRTVVSEGRAPPTRSTVDEFSAVFQNNARTMTSRSDIDGRR